MLKHTSAQPAAMMWSYLQEQKCADAATSRVECRKHETSAAICTMRGMEQNLTTVSRCQTDVEMHPGKKVEALSIPAEQQPVFSITPEKLLLPAKDTAVFVITGLCSRAGQWCKLALGLLTCWLLIF